MGACLKEAHQRTQIYGELSPAAFTLTLRAAVHFLSLSLSPTHRTLLLVLCTPCLYPALRLFHCSNKINLANSCHNPSPLPTLHLPHASTFCLRPCPAATAMTPWHILPQPFAYPAPRFTPCSSSNDPQAACVAESVEQFITAMDSLKLNMRAVGAFHASHDLSVKLTL